MGFRVRINMMLPTITTIGPDWRDKVKRAGELGLKEVNIFPTCLKQKERQEFYQLLDKAGIRKIPFVHLRQGMAPSELDFLIEKYKTEVFNIHTNREFSFQYDYQKYRDKIYIENTIEPYDEKEIKEFAGICIDFAHLENARIFKPKLYEHNIKVIEKYKCGCNHISPAVNFSLYDEAGRSEHHPHTLINLSQLNYLKNYPAKYFSHYIGIELENNIDEQIRAIEYIKSIDEIIINQINHD